MTSPTLNIVIDERKQWAGLPEIASQAAQKAFVSAQNRQQSVFKDYILSSEVFYISPNQ